MTDTLALGLVVNPVAGIGGPAALRGSDTPELQRQAAARGAVSAALTRARRAFIACAHVHPRLRLSTWGGAMGEAAVSGLSLPIRVIGSSAVPTAADDTRRAVTRLVEEGVDLLLFAGGDGTARDVLSAVPLHQVVLGIPAGVKMRSGVFTVTPEDAGAVIVRLIEGGLVAADVAQVQDVDDLTPRTYGELHVPRIGGYLQHLKSGGIEVEALALTEIAASIAERCDAHPGTVVMGPGSTTMAIKEKLGFRGTLLGVDVVERGGVVALNADARTLEAIVPMGSALVVSFTRDQGFLFGRGNQQLSASMLKRIRRQDIWVVGTRTKLKSLGGRALRVDTNDATLDRSLAGLIEIVTGYDDACYHRIA